MILQILIFYFKIISLVNQDFATENGLTSDSTVDDLLAIDGAKFVGIASQVSSSIPERLWKGCYSKPLI